MLFLIIEYANGIFVEKNCKQKQNKLIETCAENVSINVIQAKLSF